MKARLRMSFKTWMVIYPSITLFLFLFGEQLSPFPLYLRTLILTIALVPWMMFIGIPVLEYVMKLISGNTISRQQNKITRDEKIR